jgi:hypothetical protein
MKMEEWVNTSHKNGMAYGAKIKANGPGEKFVYGSYENGQLSYVGVLDGQGKRIRIWNFWAKDGKLLYHVGFVGDKPVIHSPCCDNWAWFSFYNLTQQQTNEVFESMKRLFPDECKKMCW